MTEKITPKKRVNSKNKGSGNERVIANLLSDTFKPLKFMRTPGSGAVIGGKNFDFLGQFMSDEAKSVFVGDVICVNEKDHSCKFLRVIEAKFYKDAEKMEHLLNGKSKIYSWMEEVLTDAEKVQDKEGIVICKWNNTPHYAAVTKDTILPDINKIVLINGIQVCYLSELLKFKDFWIKQL